MFNKKTKLNKGFSLVEILVGSGIICLSLLLVIDLETSVSRIGFNSLSTVKANMLAEEGVVAVENAKDISWQNINTLNNNIPYNLVWDDTLSSWQILATSTLIDNKFNRTVTFYPVNRDNYSFNILDQGGSVDFDTRKFIVNVVWFDGSGTSTRSLSSYVYNPINK